MALMDLVGLGADKQAVIIDIGSVYTKVGFAGEHAPRHILKTEITKYVDGALTSTSFLDMAERKEEEKSNFFRSFFHKLYFKYLLVNPKERRVVICESMLKSIATRNIIAHVLFKYFDIISIVFLSNHLLALYACGVKTGLVVDCGYVETSVVPIYEQTPIFKAIEYIDVGGQSIHVYINTEIMTNCIVQIGDEEKAAKVCLNELSETILEDIKVRCCFVGRHECKLTASPVKYPLNGNTTLYLDGKMRSRVFNSLFEENDDEKSIPACILNAILNSPIDCRKELAENIILIGGSVLSPGFESRLMEELNLLLNSKTFNTKLFVKKIAFRKPLIPANYCAWQGGALFGALEILNDHSISRERYHVNKLIPDWSSTLAIDKETMSKNLLDEKYKWVNYRKTLPLTAPSGSPSLTTTAIVTERLKREFGLTVPK